MEERSVRRELYPDGRVHKGHVVMSLPSCLPSDVSVDPAVALYNEESKADVEHTHHTEQDQTELSNNSKVGDIRNVPTAAYLSGDIYPQCLKKGKHLENVDIKPLASTSSQKSEKKNFGSLFKFWEVQNEKSGGFIRTYEKKKSVMPKQGKLSESAVNEKSVQIHDRISEVLASGSVKALIKEYATMVKSLGKKSPSLSSSKNRNHILTGEICKESVKSEMKSETELVVKDKTVELTSEDGQVGESCTSKSNDDSFWMIGTPAIKHDNKWEISSTKTPKECNLKEKSNSESRVFETPDMTGVKRKNKEDSGESLKKLRRTPSLRKNCFSPTDLSPESLTPDKDEIKRSLKKHGWRKLMSMDPGVYSQLISPPTTSSPRTSWIPCKPVKLDGKDPKSGDDLSNVIHHEKLTSDIVDQGTVDVSDISPIVKARESIGSKSSFFREELAEYESCCESMTAKGHDNKSEMKQDVGNAVHCLVKNLLDFSDTSLLSSIEMTELENQSDSQDESVVKVDDQIQSPILEMVSEVDDLCKLDRNHFKKTNTEMSGAGVEKGDREISEVEEVNGTLVLDSEIEANKRNCKPVLVDLNLYTSPVVHDSDNTDVNNNDFRAANRNNSSPGPFNIQSSNESSSSNDSMTEANECEKDKLMLMLGLKKSYPVISKPDLPNFPDTEPVEGPNQNVENAQFAGVINLDDHMAKAHTPVVCTKDLREQPSVINVEQLPEKEIMGMNKFISVNLDATPSCFLNVAEADDVVNEIESPKSSRDSFPFDPCFSPDLQCYEGLSPILLQPPVTNLLGWSPTFVNNIHSPEDVFTVFDETDKDTLRTDSPITADPSRKRKRPKRLDFGDLDMEIAEAYCSSPKLPRTTKPHYSFDFSEDDASIDSDSDTAESEEYSDRETEDTDVEINSETDSADSIICEDSDQQQGEVDEMLCYVDEIGQPRELFVHQENEYEHTSKLASEPASSPSNNLDETWPVYSQFPPLYSQRAEVPGYQDLSFHGNPQVAVLADDSSELWQEIGLGSMSYSVFPSQEVLEYAMNCYNLAVNDPYLSQSFQSTSMDHVSEIEINPFTHSNYFEDQTNQYTAVKLNEPVETNVPQDQWNENDYIYKAVDEFEDNDIDNDTSSDVSMDQESIEIEVPQTAVGCQYNGSLESACFVEIATNKQGDNEVEVDNVTVEKAADGDDLMTLMESEVRRNIQRTITERRASLEESELCGRLKFVRPYVISGWLSTTYLTALVNKTDLINDLFKKPMDDTGRIHDWIIKSCTKTKPEILARDLVFRLFTLLELQDLDIANLGRYSRYKAIKQAVMRRFKVSQLTWKKKCIPYIISSVDTLFSTRVKVVQNFFLLHSC